MSSNRKGEKARNRELWHAAIHCYIHMNNEELDNGKSFFRAVWLILAFSLAAAFGYVETLPATTDRLVAAIAIGALWLISTVGYLQTINRSME